MRTVPPARSRITPAALVAGVGGILGGSGRADLLSALVARYGSSGGLLTDSGTSALQLALAAAHGRGLGPVALPAYCCYDLITAAVGAEVPVILYDLDPESLEPDAESLERAFDAGARTLVTAHLYGVPASADRLREECRRRGVLFIEDAAQEAGATVGGTRAGSFGALTVLSFGRGKGLTGGSGGALLCDEEGLEVLESIESPTGAAGGIGDVVDAAALWVLGRPSLFWLPKAIPGLHIGETLYRTPGVPSLMSAAGAAIANANLAGLDQERRIRRSNAERLLAAIPPGGDLTPVRPTRADLEPGWLRLPVLSSVAGVSDGTSRLGIAKGYPKPLNEVEAGRRLLVRPDDMFPGAARLSRELLTLPTHGWLSERDLRALEAWVGRPRG